MCVVCKDCWDIAIYHFFQDGDRPLSWIWDAFWDHLYTKNTWNRCSIFDKLEDAYSRSFLLCFLEKKMGDNEHFLQFFYPSRNAITQNWLRMKQTTWKLVLQYNLRTRAKFGVTRKEINKKNTREWYFTHALGDCYKFWQILCQSFQGF